MPFDRCAGAKIYNMENLVTIDEFFSGMTPEELESYKKATVCNFNTCIECEQLLGSDAIHAIVLDEDGFGESHAGICPSCYEANTSH